jgi:protein-tyrosine phosphatase
MGRAGTRRLEYRTIFNVRDLAGIETPAGTIKPRRFLRSGDTMFLSRKDLHSLLSLGVTRVLDLRMPLERPRETSPFAHLNKVVWKSAPLPDELTLTREEAATGKVVDFLVRQYEYMLSQHKDMREVLHFLAASRPDECVLIHCAMGQDRTGIVCMLIEGLCGAPADTLVSDYAYSFDSDEVVDHLVATFDPTAPAPVFDGTEARIKAMFDLLGRIDATYGTIENMVRSWGVTSADITAIVEHATLDARF